MNIAEHVERGAGEYPNRPALVVDGKEISYRDLDDASSRAAGAFAAAGVSAGDRVALFLPNIPEFAVAYLGGLKLGAIAVSISSALKRDEVAFILADSGAKIVVTTAEMCEQVPVDAVDRVFIVGADFDAALAEAAPISSPRPMGPDDPAAIVYTSGTTGQPKGATLSHSNVIRNAEAKGRYLDIRPEDRGLLFMPIYHCFGQNAIFNAFLQAGAAVVLHRRFDLNRVLESIAKDRVTMFFAVPTTYILLLDKVSPTELCGVRYYFSAAAPMPVEIEERWKQKFGLPIFQGYGLTETSPFASYNHLERHRPGSIGTPIEGVELKIVDTETGGDAAPGELGEIVVRGHNVMLGYWNRPEETAAAIRDGWFHTGDIGRVDPRDGYFFIEDRLTDMIISGGVNVYPAEVENVLLSHPEVAEAAVYGVAEPLLGEQVRADVVLKFNRRSTETDLRAFCRERLAGVKVPAVVRFVDEIPKSPTGKVLKRVLRERAGSVPRTGALNRKRIGREEAERWIVGWLRNNLGLPTGARLDSRAPFADAGLDSITAVRLAEDAAAWSGQVPDVTIAWSFPTPEALAGHLATRDASEEDVETLLLAELEHLNR